MQGRKKVVDNLIGRLVRGIQEIYVKTLDLADKPRGAGRDVINRQQFVAPQYKTSQ